MIWVLTGNNDYGLKKRLKELTDDFLSKNDKLGLERIDAAETEPQTILEAVQAQPFLSGRKFIVISDLSKNRPASDQIEQIISSISDTNDLVIYEPEIDRRNSYFKVLKKQKGYEEYSLPDAANLSKWLVDEAQKQGAKLSHADANYLVDRLGDNQLNLASELDKLITYDPAISRANIDLLTARAPQSRIFDLLDAVFSGSKKRALGLYTEQKAQKVEPQAILAMLVWQLELVAIASEAGNMPAPEIARLAGVSPYPLNKAKTIAAKLDRTKLKQLINELYKIDILAKSKPIDLDEALTTFIAAI